MSGPLDRRRQKAIDAVAGALPSSWVRWAVARGAPAARTSGRTSLGSTALAHALATLASPPKRLWVRTGEVEIDEIADRVDRPPEEIRRWMDRGLLGAAGSGDAWDRSVLDRAALIDLALGAGADEQQLAVAATEGNLVWVVLERVLTAGGELTGRQAAARAGLPMPVMESVWRGLGLPAGELDAPAFDRRDVHALRTIDALRAVFPAEDLAEVSSVVGRAMSEVSAALTDLFRRRIAEPFLAAGGTETDVVLRLAAMRDLLRPTVFPLLEIALHRHLRVAVGAELSLAMEQILGPGTDQRVLSVAFADLVGFTELTAQLPPREVQQLAATLYRIAEEVVTGHGGRIVKSIGDAVMFTTADAEQCAVIAVELVGRVRAEPELPPVRAGIGHGPVLSSYADYFGRTVNLAARLCAVAGPHEVLLHVDAPDVDPGGWETDLRLEPRRISGLKGIEGEVSVFAIGPD